MEEGPFWFRVLRLIRLWQTASSPWLKGYLQNRTVPTGDVDHHKLLPKIQMTSKAGELTPSLQITDLPPELFQVRYLFHLYVEMPVKVLWDQITVLSSSSSKYCYHKLVPV